MPMSYDRPTACTSWPGRATWPWRVGAVRRMDADVGEIKRMFVRPAARSRGVAGALLEALEATARSLGYRRVRLDTGPKQVHAIRLYQRAGYVPIDPYNDNPFASFWGEKELKPRSPEKQ